MNIYSIIKDVLKNSSRKKGHTLFKHHTVNIYIYFTVPSSPIKVIVMRLNERRNSMRTKNRRGKSSNKILEARVEVIVTNKVPKINK